MLTENHFKYVFKKRFGIIEMRKGYWGIVGWVEISGNFEVIC